jgi:hypothetical protein
MPSMPDPILHLQGREQRPLIMLDDFWSDPHALREDAASLKMGQIGPHSGGARGRAHAAGGDDAEAAGAVARAVFRRRSRAGGVGGLLFARHYVARRSRADPAAAAFRRGRGEPDRGAAVPGRGRAGGAAFYRQRATGFESVDGDRLDRFKAELEGVRAHGMPEASYIAGDTAQYEQIACQPARFNRALVYAGNTLRCAYLPPARIWSRRSTRRGCRAIIPRSVGIA